ncbi:cyclic AMP receptor-like protein A isoform X1 [Tubulanus polymorphus]|uniref:cyclic AMP receptor-like protein A isoform X1 n=1 Tax=Tubulanus polymorphus TaxID=672921 RepID=UPI003DA2533D
MAFDKNQEVNLAASNVANTSMETIRCTLFPQNQHQCDVIIGVKQAMAALSLVGCLFMIVVIWIFRKYASFTQRLILYLTISALLHSTAYLMGELHPDGPLCDFQAFWLTMLDWNVLLWVCCITVNLYMNAIQAKLIDRYEWAFHVVAWLFSLFMACLPFIGDHYGPAGAWCWVVDDARWRFGIWYGPLFGIIFMLFSVYIYITVMVKRRVKTWEGLYDPDTERKKQMLKEDVKPLIAYPCVYLVCSSFSLINRIQNAVNPGNPVFALVLLQAIFSPVQGMLNAIVFGLDKNTRSKLTPSQIRVALASRNEPSIIREYPVAFRSLDAGSDENAISRGNNQEFSQIPKYNNVSYSRLH